MHERNKWKICGVPSDKQTSRDTLSIIPCKESAVTLKLFAWSLQLHYNLNGQFKSLPMQQTEM